MKIDDFLDKILATGSNVTRRSKPADMPKSEATTQAAADKLRKEAKPDNAPDYVDKYESRRKSSESTTRQESSPSKDSVPVREDKVERAKQLVAAGAYDDQDVIAKIIDRLIETIREA